MNITDKKILLYTHNSGGTGNYDDELYDFLVRNGVDDIVKIDFPFGQRSEKAIRFKRFNSEKEIIRFESVIKFSTPVIVSYVKDLLYGIFYGFKFAKNTNLFFGMDNLLTLIGIFFKKIGLIKEVAYIIIDYTPVRYNIKILDNIYYAVDRFCLYNSDYVIPLNEAMIEARIRDKKLNRAKINYIVTPFGNHSLSKNIKITKNNKIVYFGQISKDKGAELFVPIAKSLIVKEFNDFVFEVIGGGDVEYLKKQIKDEGLEKYFNVYGRINEVEKIEDILMSCSIALAPYYPEDKNNFSYYADPGKVKFYLGCGLPMVITDVPPIAKDIEKNECGVVSEYNSDNFAGKIIEILSNEEKYLRYKNNSIEFGKKFDWDVVFISLFKNIK